MFFGSYSDGFEFFGTEVYIKRTFFELFNVIFDCDLTFGEHISKKMNEANVITGLIRSIFTFLDYESVSKLYCAIIRPHLGYAQSIWSPHLSRDIATS